MRKESHVCATLNFFSLFALYWNFHFIMMSCKCLSIDTECHSTLYKISIIWMVVPFRFSFYHSFSVCVSKYRSILHSKHRENIQRVNFWYFFWKCVQTYTIFYSYYNSILNRLLYTQMSSSIGCIHTHFSILKLLINNLWQNFLFFVLLQSNQHTYGHRKKHENMNKAYKLRARIEMCFVSM